MVNFRKPIAFVSRIRFAISADIGRRQGIPSTDMPPETVAEVPPPLSPERTTETTNHPILELAIPLPLLALGIGNGVASNGPASSHEAPDQHMAPASVNAKRNAENDGANGYSQWMAVARLEQAKGKGEGKGQTGSQGESVA